MKYDRLSFQKSLMLCRGNKSSFLYYRRLLTAMTCTKFKLPITSGKTFYLSHLPLY